MAYQPEQDQFDSGVYQLEKTDPVLAGLGGVSNTPLLSLANRTKYLYNRIAEILGITKNYALAGGTANAITGAYTPVVSTLVDGMTLKFKGGFANTGAATFTPNTATTGGIAAAPIYGLDHQPLTGGEIVVSGNCAVQWNAALNSGAGAWVLIENSGGIRKGVTPAQFDASNAAATMAALQRFGMQSAAWTPVSSNTSLTAANCGQTIAAFGSTAFSVNLPQTTACPVGARIEFLSAATVAVNLFRSGTTDQIVCNAATVTQLVANPGDTVTFENAGGGKWYAVAGSLAGAATPAQFDSSTKLATTGFVQRSLGNFQTAIQTALSGTTVLTASQAGGFIQVQGGTITLPASSTLQPGNAFWFFSSGATSLYTASGDIVAIGSGTSSATGLGLGAGDFIGLCYLGVFSGKGVWEVISGSTALGWSAAFSSSLASSGYQKLPNGWILQWTSALSSASADTPVTWPIAFPNTCFTVLVTPNNNGYSIPTQYNQSKTGTLINNWQMVSGNPTRMSGAVQIVAIGN